MTTPDESVMACRGAWTRDDGDFVECIGCARRVRHDLRDHPFWGFSDANCPVQIESHAQDAPKETT